MGEVRQDSSHMRERLQPEASHVNVFFKVRFGPVQPKTDLAVGGSTVTSQRTFAARLGTVQPNPDSVTSGED